MVTFLKTFYAQDKQKHLAYYQKADVVVVNDPNNDLENYSVGQTAEVTGYLVGHGDKKHGYSWELNVAQ